MHLHDRCRQIEMLILDVDGVLTDGKITYTSGGEEIKSFHVRDGSGLKVWHRLEKKSGIITGRSSSIVERRAKELGIAEVRQGSEDKRTAFREMIARAGVTASQVAYLGDDLPDLPLLHQAGLAVTVADGCEECKAVAHYVCEKKGGGGAVREAIELVLRAQGRWAEVVASFMKE